MAQLKLRIKRFFKKKSFTSLMGALLQKPRRNSALK
jgi:hypothetical protein